MNRSPFSFANINLLGKCNLDCFFCLGKDLEIEFSKYNTVTTLISDLPKLIEFLELCKYNKISQLYITGQNTDPLLYADIENLIQFVKSEGFYVGIRTNGMLALEKMDIINQCTTCKGDAVAFTILTRNPIIQMWITSVRKVPDWDVILGNIKVPYRISIVVCEQNEQEISDLILWLSNGKFILPKYIQIRRISTEHRKNELEKHIEAYNRVKRLFMKSYSPIDYYESAPVFELGKMKIVLWETVNTTANSLNYFSNGIISDEYFIIKGYEKQMELNNMSKVKK